MNRIVIVGSTGSGKTTLARELSRGVEAPHIELDAFNWGPNWTAVSQDLFRARVSEAVSAERWIVDGNYHVIRDIVWPRADCIVWLNYSLPVVLGRLLRRTARRILTGEPCCNGNRESLRMAFSKESILLWALCTYGRRKKEFPPLLAERAAAGTTIVEHETPAETDAWLRRAALRNEETVAHNVARNRFLPQIPCAVTDDCESANE
jgi:adenylate kinase family enzyme